jgi:hypothetical protein
MRRLVGWLALISLGGVTVFDGLLLSVAQTGNDFVQGGPEPAGLQFAWVMLACKIIGLGFSPWTGTPMIAIGLIDWIASVAFLPPPLPRQPFFSNLMDSAFFWAYPLLAVIYTAATRRWWSNPFAKRRDGTPPLRP